VCGGQTSGGRVQARYFGGEGGEIDQPSKIRSPYVLIPFICMLSVPVGKY